MVSALDSGSSVPVSNSSPGTALCSKPRQFALTVPFSTQFVEMAIGLLLERPDRMLESNPSTTTNLIYLNTSTPGRATVIHFFSSQNG